MACRLRRDISSALRAEVEPGVQVAAVDPEPRHRVEEAADEPLVGDALGQLQAFLERAERRLVLPDARARNALAPEAPDQRDQQPVLAADLDSLAGNRQRVPKAPLPDGRQGAEKGQLPLQTEVADRAADGERPLDLGHRLLRVPLELEDERADRERAGQPELIAGGLADLDRLLRTGERRVEVLHPLGGMRVLDQRGGLQPPVAHAPGQRQQLLGRGASGGILAHPEEEIRPRPMDGHERFRGRRDRPGAR